MSQHPPTPTPAPAPGPTPGPQCGAYAPLLPLLGSALLTPAEDAQLRAHLADCPWCQLQRAADDHLDAALRQHYAPITPHPPLRLEDIMPNAQRPNDQPSTPPFTPTTPAIPTTAPSTTSTRPRRALLPLVSIAAALLVAIFVGLAYASHNLPAATPTPTFTAATPAPTPTSTAFPPLPACQTTQLTLSLYHSGVALGHSSATYSFTNTSSHPCSLTGYPTLQLLDAQQQPITTHEQHTTTAYTFNVPPTHEVDLVPGAIAYFFLEYTNNPSTGATCPTAASLRIIPPNQSAGYIDASPLSPCGSALLVSPVENTSNQFPPAS